MVQGSRGTYKYGDVGSIFETRTGLCKIVQYIPASASRGTPTMVRVRFERKPNYECLIDMSSLRRKSARDPYYPIVCGVGYMGEGPYTSTVAGKKSRLYAMWQAMLERCYTEKKQRSAPSYIGCSVVKRWHNFQLFALDVSAWPNCGRKGFELDKDCLKLNNKIYGPHTCCFLPVAINGFLSTPLGATGINYHTRRKADSPFSTYIKIEGVNIALGSYASEAAAARAYRHARADRLRMLIKRYKRDLPPNVQAKLLALVARLIK